MTCLWRAQVLLFLLFLNHVWTEKLTDDFRAEGGNYMMGYCFEADYIVVYRIGPKGDQLLGNSSINRLPPHLHGRVHFSHEDNLVGLRIKSLTELDSGIYRRECWRNQSLVSQDTKRLSVCKEELVHEEIVVNEEGGAELLCNSSYVGQPGVSVRWYLETNQADSPVLFLDTRVSMKPPTEGLRGVVEPRNKGTVLVLDETALKSTIQFFCLVIKDENCLSFKNMYQAESSEIRYNFASEGDRVVLQCNASDDQQQWETPEGMINSSSTTYHQMHISTANSDFSLIIPAAANEHKGMYSCISQSFEIQYSLVLCPKAKSMEMVANKGEKISLDCNFPQNDSYRVIWFRRAPSEQYEVISNSDDHTVPAPKDLVGRLTLTHYEFSLEISDVGMRDAGVYGCVLFTSPGFVTEDYDYDDDGNYTEYDYEKETEYGELYEDSERCFFKQETFLNIADNSNIDVDVKNVNPTDESSKSTVYVVPIVLVVLGVLAVLVIVVVKKKRKAASRNQSHMDEDSGCTEKLNSDHQNSKTKDIKLENLPK